MPLQRFHDAQADADDGYEAALAEMRWGRKRKHWIWYVFPQLAGLGCSESLDTMAFKTSRKRAITYAIQYRAPTTKRSLLPWPNNWKQAFRSSG